MPPMSERDSQTWAAIQHLKKLRKELDLNIRALESTLPDRKPTEKQPMYVLTPDGRSERIN